MSLTGPTTATGLSRRREEALSHNHITYWLSRTPCGSAQVWRQAKLLIRQAEARCGAADFAVLIVDGLMLKKAHNDDNCLILNYSNNSQQRYIKDLNFLSLLY